jgi:hypothetical protein
MLRGAGLPSLLFGTQSCATKNDIAGDRRYSFDISGKALLPTRRAASATRRLGVASRALDCDAITNRDRGAEAAHDQPFFDLSAGPFMARIIRDNHGTDAADSYHEEN